MNKHNKKRNVGIMYELLLRHISSQLIENNKQNAKIATRILEKRYAKNTELYKEFRLFNALAKTNVASTEIAAAILTEAKNAARRFNKKRLQKEKSALINEINHTIRDKKFYYRSVPDYRQYANIHNMINEWQKGDESNLKLMVELEQVSLSHLMEEKIDIAYDDSNIDTRHTNVLVQKIMTKKINEKYSGMTKDQKDILKAYALYGTDDKSHEQLKHILSEKKSNSLNSLKLFVKKNENSHLNGKVKLVESKIIDLNVNELDDKMIVKFLTLTDLVREIKSGE